MYEPAGRSHWGLNNTGLSVAVLAAVYAKWPLREGGLLSPSLRGEGDGAGVDLTRRCAAPTSSTASSTGQEAPPLGQGQQQPGGDLVWIPQK